MSHATAYNRVKDYNPIMPKQAASWFWFVLKDRNGKVRDWAPAANAKDARNVFAQFRDYAGIPKGYTVEKRGPVTRENW